jgi:tRNA 2-thiouridine synthesizing protein E
MSNESEVVFDKHGFMRDPQQWNAELASTLAESVGLDELDALSIRVLEYLREHYLTNGSVLPEEEVCRANGLTQHCIRDLFENYEKAWKTAGLPDPGIQLREFMEDAG